jgi:transcriptional regulator with XRE-family HTH domain
MAQLLPAPRTHHPSAVPTRPAPQVARRGVNREVARRLHDAVRAAGGNQAVALRSGVPLATVNNYVRGRNGMKIEPLVAIAAACNIALDWIVSGDEAPAPGSPAPGAFPIADATPPPGLGEAQTDVSPGRASDGVDVRILAKAIEIVAAIAGPDLRDDPRALARRIATTYAVLTEPEASRD